MTKKNDNSNEISNNDDINDDINNDINNDISNESMDKMLKHLFQGNLGISATKNKKKNNKNNDEDKYIATLSFGLTNYGDIDILTDWTSYEANIAISYGKLLHMLTTGHLNQQIAYILSMQDKDTQSLLFANQILAMWYFLNKQQNTEPVISPVQALKVSKPPEMGV